MKTGTKWEIITLYEAMVTDDDKGARSHSIGTFSTESLAKEFGVGKSYYGSDGTVVPRQAVVLFEADENGRTTIFNKIYAIGSGPLDVDLEERKRKAARREELLAQMSDDDKQILGLK